MIIKSIRNAALATVITLAGAPGLSLAATAYNGNQAVHANYNTTIAPIVGFGYPWSGTLQLTFNPDGIISGYYRPDGDLSFVQVTGGRQGNDVWMDIGQRGRLHITGALQNGAIVGTAWDDRSSRQYKFNASITK